MGKRKHQKRMTIRKQDMLKELENIRLALGK